MDSLLVDFLQLVDLEVGVDSAVDMVSEFVGPVYQYSRAGLPFL